jgi:hypothetical protein
MQTETIIRQDATQDILTRLARKAEEGLVDDLAQWQTSYIRGSDLWRVKLSNAATWKEWTALLPACPKWEHDVQFDKADLDKAIVSRSSVPDEVMKSFEYVYGSRYLHCDPALVQKKAMLDKASSVILAGPKGTGKTTAMAYLARTLTERACMDVEHSLKRASLVAFWRSAGIFTTLHNGGTIDNQDARYFFVDDFGREYVEPFALSQFEELVEYRYGRELPIIMTTNLSWTDFKARAGFERVTDRLLEMASWINFTGESMRQK